MSEEKIMIIDTSISRRDLETLAQETFKTMIKGVVDVEREVIALGASLHADEEAALLENGSRQKNLWGFNLHFSQDDLAQAIQYNSMINIRPHEGNLSLDIQSPDLRDKVFDIVRRKVVWKT